MARRKQPKKKYTVVITDAEESSRTNAATKKAVAGVCGSVAALLVGTGLGMVADPTLGYLLTGGRGTSGSIRP